MDEIDSRLKNWRRWLLMRDWMPSRYRSVIGQFYRSPQCWHPKEPRTIIDHLDAQEIETAVHNLPQQQQTVVILHYLSQATTGSRILRNIQRQEKYRISGLPEWTFYRQLNKAKATIANNLTSAKKGRICASNYVSVDSLTQSWKT